MSEAMRRVVVVGASVAGVHAAEAAREAGYAGELVMVGAEPHLPYDRPPLSKQALRDGPLASPAPMRAPAWYADQGIDLRLGRRAVSLDAAGRSVRLADGRELTFDGLVLATGSVNNHLPVSHDPRSVNPLRTLPDCTALHDRLRRGGHLVVVGAGFIGLEVAATAAQLGLEVTVVERDVAPLARACGAEAGAWLARFHKARGVRLRCETSVAGLEQRSRGVVLSMTDGTTVAADHVAVGLGVRPETDWLQDSGIALGDGVLCDQALRTSHPAVVAAGDLVRWPNALFGVSMRVQHWSNAVEQGRHAMRSLLGSPQPYSTAPMFWSDQFDARLRFVGRTGSHSYVDSEDDDSLVVLFGEEGRLCGALCVNATHRLPRLRQAIAARAEWCDVAPAAGAVG